MTSAPTRDGVDGVRGAATMVRAVGRASVEKARSVIAREGPIGAVRLAVVRLGKRALIDETHRWYALSLDPAPVGDGLSGDLRLVRAQQGDAALAVEMQGPVDGMVELLLAGHDLWLVCERDTCAFSCWTFHRSTPVLAARGGWMRLPDGVVCLEDSATSPDHRGRGIAPAAWREIGRTLRAEGARTIVTKVATDNVPSQRAVTKAGFREIGTMRLRRFATRRRMEVTELDPAEPTMALLAESLRE